MIPKLTKLGLKSLTGNYLYSLEVVWCVKVLADEGSEGDKHIL